MTENEPRYFNRELSWLEFNQRVLDEAADNDIPLLERMKFLAITASNLDEFFMVRVGGLHLLRQSDPSRRDPSGMSAEEQLAAISARAHQMNADQYHTLTGALEPALENVSIQRHQIGTYSARHLKVLEELFDNEISAVFTPQRVTSKADFPLLGNQSMNMCFQLAPEDEDGPPRFAILPFGQSAQRIYTLKSDGGYSYTLIEDIVASFCERFFPGVPVIESVPFRITRNADLAVDDESSDLLADMAEVLDARKQGDCVRLEIADGASDTTLEFLCDALEVKDPNAIFRAPGPLDLSAFMQLADLVGFDDCKYEPWPPLRSSDIDPTSPVFSTLAKNDVLLIHPFESFEPVVRMIEEAAEDPDVLAIKQTLYRTSKKSPIVQALRRAAERGKRVSVIVELKARFDEARNIEWAKDLEQSDVQVFYGVRGLKTHAKICIIVRREPNGIQRYIHFGTGNYNEATARIYSDISFMTADEDLGRDATSFFNAITGYSQPQNYRKIEAAPLGMRDSLLEMIETETLRKRQGQRAHIAAKLNSLADPKVIDALYRASQAGVTVKLNIRGICCLRPGIQGLSENIQVISIVDRFLEHARIFYFYHGGDERVFISSADWMPRNLDRRVELLVPVEDTDCRRRLVDALDLYFRDNVKAKELLPDGTHRRVSSSGKPNRSQQAIYEAFKKTVHQVDQFQRTVFVPHMSESIEKSK